MNLIEVLNGIVCCPDGREAGRFCGHNINSDTEISAESGNARAYKLHDFILNITVGKHCAYDSQRNVLGTYARHRLSGQINAHNLRSVYIISLAQKLLHQLRTALTHSHGSQGTVSGMAVRSQNHFSAACQHLPGKLMDNCLMGRHIHSAVAFCAGQTKHVVILIDGSAHCTERVVAVCQYIGDWEFFQP